MTLYAGVAVHYNLTEWIGDEVASLKTVRTKDEQTSQKDMWMEVKMEDQFVMYRPTFLELLEQFKTIWVRKLRKIEEEVHSIKMVLKDVRKIHTVT